MSKCTADALKKTVRFGNKAIKASNTEELKVAYMSLLGTMYKQSSPGSPEYIAKVIEATMSLPFMAQTKLKNMGSIEQIDAFIKEKGLPKEKIDSNFNKLGFVDYNAITQWIKTDAVGVTTSVTREGTHLQKEVVAAQDSDIAHNLLVDRETSVELYVEDAKNDMASKKVALNEAVEDIRKDSPDRWAAFLQVYFPSSNKLGADFTEWSREKFFDMFVDFGKDNKGFIDKVDEEVSELKDNLEDDLDDLSSVEYGSSNAEFLNRLLADVDNTGAKKKYFTSVLLNDFDFILDNLIKIIGQDARRTAAYENNKEIEGFEDGHTRMEPLLLDISGRKLAHLFDKVEDVKNRYALKPDVNPIMERLSTTSYEFLNNKDLAKSTFYHILGSNDYYFRAANGSNIILNPKKFYSYNSTSKRNTSPIDHYVNPLDNSTGFINSIMPLLKIIGKEGDVGRRMTVADFVAVAPLLVDVEPTLDAISTKLKDLSEGDSTKIGAIARSLHSYIFSTRSTFNGSFYSIRSAGRKGRYKSLNGDIVNAMFSALISKNHVRYVKVEEGRVTTTKGPNEGSESLIVDEALSGVLMDTNRYTKLGITKNIQVSGGKVLISVGRPEKANIKEVTTIEPYGNSVGMRKIAMNIGLEDLFNDIESTYKDIISGSTSEKSVVDTFRHIVEVAAANSRESHNRLPLSHAVEKATGRVDIHKDYMYLSPSTIIKENERRNLAEVFFVDSSKAQRIGGVTAQSSTTPNKNTTIKRQVKTFKRFNDDKITPTDMSHNPILIEEQEEGSSIVPAEVGDVFIKAPIVYDANVVKLSDWDLKIRIEHAMFEGFLNAPRRNVGSEFFLQVVNYSDKSSPELFQIKTDKNLLAPDPKVSTELKRAYVEYNYRKNEALQRVTLTSFREFIVGEYEYVRRSLIEDAEYLGVDSQPRVDALLELKNLLVSTDFNAQTGDMIRPFNDILDRVRINPKIIENSNADLDQGADFMTFGDNEAAFLKPTAGIRARLYRNPNTAAALVNHYLAETKALLRTATPGSLNNSVIREDELKKILARKENVVKDPGEFITRFFLINGIYGHSLKTLTMGDETYFAGKFKTDTQGEFYAQADADLESDDGNAIEMAGLEGVESMLNNQFKRAQSILSRGVVYAQQETLPGLKKNSNRDNLLQHLEIYKNRGPNNNEDIYRFKELEGKTLTELWGKGVITPLMENSEMLSARDGQGYIMAKFNIGTDQLIVSTEPGKRYHRKFPKELIEGIQDLLINIRPDDSAINTAQELVDSTVDVSGLKAGDFTRYREVALTMQNINDHYRKLEDSKWDSVVQPDYLPSMLLSDPESYINLLNKMDVEQETSDGIQFIHPLYYVMKRQARGGTIGAFNTKDFNAQKTLNTSVEYGKNRQVLQKNSGQMPFAMRQMEKVGSVELYNAFRTMNTAIDFKQNTFIYHRVVNGVRELDTDLARAKIYNLDDLFTHFDGYGKQGDKAWDTVLEVLRQNPIDLYNFVGHLNVPSNQKTGRKKYNSFENVFAKDIFKGTVPTDRRLVRSGRAFMPTPNMNIDYISNEFNFEVLTKEHGYDVSGKLNKRSSLALLSQLVNAVAFGGLSNVDAMSLQNAMGGRMRLNRLRVGRDLAIVAKEMQERPDNTFSGVDFRSIITRLEEGDVSTKNYSKQQMALYEKIMRAGVYEMAQLAFNENADSMLIKKIIKGEGYSLDTPAIQNKVMGTLRAAFFGDTVKMRMDGFQAVVSATHKTVSIYDFNGGRKARGAYILAGLEAGANHNWKEEDGRHVHINTADAETLADVEDFVLPFDKVKIVRTVKTYTPDGELIGAGEQTESYFSKSSVNFGNYTGAEVQRFVNTNGTVTTTQDDLYVILTPDVVYDDEGIYDLESYGFRKRNELIKVRTGLNGHDTYFKWYLDEMYEDSPEVLQDLILEGKLSEDVTEKYSLKWYEITRTAEDGTTEDIKDTPAFKEYYRAVMQAKSERRMLDEKESAKFRAALILETQRKDSEGNSVWDLAPAEIVLPAYMKDRFNLKDETSLHEMIGHSNNIEEQKTYLKAKLKSITPRGKRYARITEGTKHYSKMITRIYTGRSITESSPWYDEIVNHLLTSEAEHIRRTVEANPGMDPHDVELSKEAMRFINGKKEKEFDTHITQLADSFMEMLETVSTRIPGQSKQSGFVAKVVEFLDAQGNAAFAPTEHLVTTGGDFDIDTLSVLTKTMDIDGKIYSDADFRDPITDIFDFNLLDAAYKDEIQTTHRSIGAYIENYNKEANDYVTKLEGDINRAKLEGVPQSNIDRLEERLVHAKSNNIDVSKQEKITDELIGRIHKRYINILANVIANSVMGSLNNVDTTVELNTPISMSMFGPIQARLKQVFGDAVQFGMNGETFWPIVKYEELAAQGAEAIGIFATALKINSAIQASLMNYKLNYGDHAKVDTTDPFIFDHSISFNRRAADGKVEAVTKYRRGFADLDRFNITKNVSESRDLQDKLDSLKQGEDQYDGEALPTLIGMIEEEINMSKNNFTFEEKTALLEAFSEDAGTNTFDEKFLLYLKDQYSVKGAIDNNFLKAAGEALGKDLDEMSKYISVFSSKVGNSLIKPTRKNIDKFNGILDSTFGIQVPTEIAESNTPIIKLKEYLNENPNVVETAFLNVIGNQLSNDVQSQFLSAATDNAKELILGKIRSSSLTNPLITTMMVLGYDVDDTIDFLYDKSIEGILIHFAKEKGTLRRVSLTASAVENLQGFGGTGKGTSKNSLIELLRIGEQITKFRDIRNFNENAKVEQAAIDKILQNLTTGDNITADTLYKAIIDNNFRSLTIGNDSKDEVLVFNPVQMVFLHPQSRDLFINLYESEEYKMKALFRTVQETKEQAGSKNRDPLVYKNIKTALAGLKVEAFLNTPIVKDNEEHYRIGEVLYKKDDKFDTGNIVRLRLGLPNNREEFVHNFPTYLEYAKTIIKDNAGLNALSFTNTFKSTTSILSIPKLKGSNVDSAEAALIYDGFRELKSIDKIEEDVPGETALEKEIRFKDAKEHNIFKIRLYNNLSYYALLVSKGEVRKGSMIEVFDEVNFEFATFLNTLSQEYYKENFRPENPAVQDIVRGSIPTDLTLADEAANRAEDSAGYNEDFNDEFYDEQGQDDMYTQDSDETDGEGYDDDSMEVGATRRISTYTVDPKVLNIQKGNQDNIGRAYRLLDPKLRDAIFYASDIDNIAFRFFDAVADEAMPYTTLPSLNKHSAIPFIEELGKAGKRLGYKVKWNGEDAWILNYAGKTTSNGVPVPYDIYNVQAKDAAYRVPGVHLMKKNPELFLMGNIIEPISARNIRRYNNEKEKINVVAHLIPENVGKDEYKFVVDERARKIFTQELLTGDPIVKEEAGIIFNMAGAVIKTSLRNSSTITTPSFDAFLFNDTIPKANPQVRDILVPSIKILKYGDGNSVEENAIIPEMKSQIADTVNSLKTGESVSFFGLKDNNQLAYQEQSFVLAAGIDIVEDFVSSFMDKTKKGAIKNTMMRGAFRVKRILVEGTGTYEYRITRVAKGRFITMVDKVPVAMWIDPDTGAIKTNNSGNTAQTAQYKAVDNGYSNTTHTKHRIKINDATYDAMVINFGKPITVIKIAEEGYNDKYYKVSARTPKTEGFRDDYMTFYADNATLKSINKQIADSNATPTNLKCN